MSETKSIESETPAAVAGAAPCSADDIVLELKLPVPVKELAAVTDALCKIHGKNTLFMRQVGPMLQLYKPRAASPPNAKVSDPARKSKI